MVILKAEFSSKLSIGVLKHDILKLSLNILFLKGFLYYSLFTYLYLFLLIYVYLFVCILSAFFGLFFRLATYLQLTLMWKELEYFHSCMFYYPV